MQHKMKRILLALVLTFMLAISVSSASADQECYSRVDWCMGK